MTLAIAIENLKKASGETWLDKFKILSPDDQSKILSAHGKRFQIYEDSAYDDEGNTHQVTRNGEIYVIDGFELSIINQEEHIYAFITEECLKGIFEQIEREINLDLQLYQELAENLLNAPADHSITKCIDKFTKVNSMGFFLHYLIRYSSKKEQRFLSELRLLQGDPTAEARKKEINEEFAALRENKRTLIYDIISYLHNNIDRQFYNELMYVYQTQDAKNTVDLLKTSYPSIVQDFDFPTEHVDQNTHLSSVSFSVNQSVKRLVTYTTVENKITTKTLRDFLTNNFLDLKESLSVFFNDYQSTAAQDKKLKAIQDFYSIPISDAEERLPGFNNRLKMVLLYLDQIVTSGRVGYGTYAFTLEPQYSCHELNIKELVGLTFTELMRLKPSMIPIEEKSHKEVLIRITDILYEVMCGYAKYSNQIELEEADKKDTAISKCFLGSRNDLIAKLYGSEHISIIYTTELSLVQEVSCTIKELYKELKPSEFFQYEIAQLMASWVVTGKIKVELLKLLEQKDINFAQYLEATQRNGGISKELATSMINKLPGAIPQELREFVFNNIELLQDNLVPAYVFVKEKWLYSSTFFLERLRLEPDDTKRNLLLHKISSLKKYHFSNKSDFIAQLVEIVTTNENITDSNKLLLLKYLITTIECNEYAIKLIKAILRTIATEKVLKFLFQHDDWGTPTISLLLRYENIHALEYLISEGLYKISDTVLHPKNIECTHALLYAIQAKKTKLLEWVLTQELEMSPNHSPMNYVIEAFSGGNATIISTLAGDKKFSYEFLNLNNDSILMALLKSSYHKAAFNCILSMHHDEMTYVNSYEPDIMKNNALALIINHPHYKTLLPLFLSKLFLPTFEKIDSMNLTLCTAINIMLRFSDFDNFNEVVEEFFTQYINAQHQPTTQDALKKILRQVIFLYSENTEKSILELIRSLSLSTNLLLEASLVYLVNEMEQRYDVTEKYDTLLRIMRQSLFESGNISYTDPKGEFLKRQVKKGCESMVKEMLPHYIQYIEQNLIDFICTSLCKTKNFRIVLDFAKNYLHIQWTNTNSPLLLYLNENIYPNFDVIECIVQHNFNNINQKRKYSSETALLLFMRYGCTQHPEADKIVQLFIDNGAQNITGKSKASPLSLALLDSYNNNPIVVKLLAEAPGFLEQEFANQQNRKSKQSVYNIFRPGLPDKLREAGVNEGTITLATELLEKITSQTRKRDAELASIEEVEESVEPSNNVAGTSLSFLSADRFQRFGNMNR